MDATGSDSFMNCTIGSQIIEISHRQNLIGRSNQVGEQLDAIAPRGHGKANETPDAGAFPAGAALLPLLDKPRQLP
jgi:hypothetical protein